MEPICDTSPYILRSSYKDYIFQEDPNISIPLFVLKSIETYVSNGVTTTGIVNAVTGNCTFYKDLPELSARIASSLYKHGFRKGDTLVYTTDEVEMLHPFLLGVWRANGIIRASYPEDTGDGLLSRILDSKVKFILCDSQNAQAVLATTQIAPWPIKIFAFGSPTDGCTSVAELFSDDGTACPELLIQASDVAAVMPTSGTTGKSKGAMHTHGGLIANFLVVQGIFREDDPTKAFLHLGKATHSMCVQAFAHIAAGRTLVRTRMSSFTMEIIAKAIQETKPFTVLVLPSIFMKLIEDLDVEKYNFESLELVALVGDPVTQEMIDKINRLPSTPSVGVLYGCTETLSISYSIKFSAVSRSRIEVLDLPPRATGILLPETSLAVRSENGTLLPKNEIGELWAKARHTSIGYLNNEEGTKSTYENGWVRTGDLGYYDGDGFVYVVGRSKDVFKYLGNQISPTEIESLLRKHPLIAEACVVGIPDAAGGGMIPKAYVLLKDSSNAQEGWNREILEFANAQLSSYKQLRGGIELRDSFPYGPGGKILRKAFEESIQIQN